MRLEAQDLVPLDHKLNHTKVLIAVMLLAAVLRFWGLGSKSLWLDEIMSQRRARGTFSQMIGEVAAGDAHPPGYYALQWLAKPLGRSEFAVRVPAAVAGVAVVLATYLLGSALLGGVGGLAAAGGLGAAAFAAISPFQIYYSQEARPYALAMLLASLSLWLLLRLLAEPSASKPAASCALPWIAYTLLAAAMLYTYYYLAFVLVAEGAILAASWPQSKRIIKRWLVSRAAAAALFAPYLLVLAQRMAAAQEAPPLQSRIDVLASLPGAFAHMLTGFDLEWLNAGPAASAVVYAIALVPAALALAMLRSNRLVFRSALLFVLIPAGAVLVLPWRLQVFEPKHLAFVAPMLMILAVYVPVRYAARPVAWLGVGLLAALNVVSLADYRDAEFQKERWPEACEILRENARPGDVIAFNPPWIAYGFDHYCPRAARPDPAQDLSRPAACPPLAIGPGAKRLWIVREYGSNVAPAMPEIDRQLGKLIVEQQLRQAEFQWQSVQRTEAVLPGYAGTLEARLYRW